MCIQVLCKYLCVYAPVHMFLRMCAGLCVHLCVCSCEGPKLMLRTFSHLPSTLFFEAGSLVSLEHTDMAGPASQVALGEFPISTSWDLNCRLDTIPTPPTPPYMGARGPSSSPYLTSVS